ncbi:MAG: HD domain-containing protein [Proteobacteria bacterium]|nr:HD domain-containing protein [Pseudomonadota bacterium]
MNKNILGILNLLKLAERLKSELRHSWLSSGRQESVAEHTWQMALMAILVHNHLDKPVNLEHTLKMIIVHDLVEAEAGDIPFFETGKRKTQKSQKEQKAIENIKRMIDAKTGKDIYFLFQEFEEGKTPEAKLAKALDHLEVQAQHNLADFSTWEKIEYDLVYTKMDEPCAHDSFLQQLCYALKIQAEEKMQANGIDVTSIKRRL